MRVYHSMPRDEFIAELRAAAIRSKVPPLVIHALDDLASVEGNSERVEELEAEVEELEGEIKELEFTVSELERQLADG